VVDVTRRTVTARNPPATSAKGRSWWRS